MKKLSDFKHNTPVYNQRIKIFPTGEIQVRTYKTSISNKSDSKDKKLPIEVRFSTYDKKILKGWHIKKDGYADYIVKEFKFSSRCISKAIFPKKTKIKKNDEPKTIRKDSLSRTRTMLYDYAMTSYDEWCSFVTLTFSEHITDINEANKKFNRFIDKFRRNAKRKLNIDFKYIGVPEFQKSGRVHYHFLCNVPCHSELIYVQSNRPRRWCKKNKKWFTNFDVLFWEQEHGFSSVLDFKECDESFDPILYMIKYLYKDLDNRLFGRKKLLKTNNLELPLTLKTIDGFYDRLTKYCDDLISNNYATKKEFDFIGDQPYQIPFNEKKYSLNKNNYNIDKFNSEVVFATNTDKYYDNLLPF